MGETWKTVHGHEGYEVSDHGHVRNVRTGRILTPMWNGRAKVRLSTNPRVDRDVAHLVAEAFLQPCPARPYVMHRDDNPQNNAVANLRWGTHQENMRDMAAKGRGGLQKLTAADVAAIRSRRSAGERGRDLATTYGVSEQRICDIHKGRTTL